jgi:hypothetical protein
MIILNPVHLHIQICHRCKPYSQTKRRGGCAGPCPCHWDGKDIIEHARSGYCPIGSYPFAGLGTLVTRWLWRLRIPQALRLLRLFNPTRCKCAARQAKLNRFGKWVASLFKK